MGIIHFLNVNEGDCIWIEHPSEHNTIIDISNGQEVTNIFESASSSGNHNQKNYPVNPIKDLFETFEVLNFWDTENTKVMDDNMSWGRYDKADWDFYQEIRTSLSSPKVLNLYAGQKGKYYNQTEDGKSGNCGIFD